MLDIKYHKKVLTLHDLFFCALYLFKAYWLIGDVGKRAAARIKHQTGADVDGYSVILRTEELKHLYYSHYKEPRQRQRNISFNDIMMLPDVVNNLSVATLDAGGAMVVQTQFPHGELFEFVLIIDNQKKRLYGKSFRIKT